MAKNMFPIYICAIIASFFIFTPDIKAISLAPAKQTIIVKPGKSEIASIEITNNSGSEKVFTPEIDAFKIDEKAGIPVFGQRDSALSWIVPIKKEIAVKPGKKGILSFVISAPKNAEPIGHYIALFAKEKTQAVQMPVGNRVGSLLFLYIEGKMEEKLAIISFSPQKIVTDKKTKIFLVLKNLGNIHVIPEGEIVVNNWIDRQIARIKINELNRKILPNGSWSAEYEIPLYPSFFNIGPLKAKASIRYGLTRQSIDISAPFWRLHYKAIAYISEFGLTLALIILIIRKYSKK